MSLVQSGWMARLFALSQSGLFSGGRSFLWPSVSPLTLRVEGV